MGNNWFLKNKTDNSLFGPYSDEKIREYLDKKQLTEAYQLSKDKITWIECCDWSKTVASNHIGKYEIVRELGRGGMGVVYLARDVELQRNCALKVLFSQDDSHARQRFSDEAQAVAQLEHPYIIKIYEVHTAPRCFFVMEHVTGAPLQQYLLLKTISFEDKLIMFFHISEAIAYAHSKQIIHRDLKPDNILVKDNGKPVIIDFGIAKNINSSSNLTKTGDVFGTPKYMSPEAAKGEKVDERSDVYSLGVILYEILTGRVPFDGENVVEVLFQLTMQGPPISPSTLNASVKKESHIEIICLKALEKDPDKRISSASFFSEEIENVLASRPIRLKPPSKLQKIKMWCVKNIFWISTTSLALLIICVMYNEKTKIENEKIDIEKEKTDIEKKLISSKQEVILSKKKLIHNRLHLINIQKSSSDIFAEYRKIKKCYEELIEIMDAGEQKSVVRKIQQKIDDTLKFLILPDFPRIKTIKNQGGFSYSQLSLTGKYLAQLHKDKNIYIWNIQDVQENFNKKNASIIIKSAKYSKFVFSEKDKYLMFQNNGNVDVYDLKSKKTIIKHKNARLDFCKFTPNNHYVVLASKERLKFEVYDLKKKRSIKKINTSKTINKIEISANSKSMFLYKIKQNFILYTFRTNTKIEINHKFNSKITIFFNQNGDEIYFFNEHKFIIYNIKEKSLDKQSSLYQESKIDPVNISEKKFIFSDEEGLVLAEREKNIFSYKNIVLEKDKKIEALLFTGSNFLGVVQDRHFELRDSLANAIITKIKQEKSIKSIRLVTTNKGIKIQLVTELMYRSYEILFNNLVLDKIIINAMQGKDQWAKKALSESKIFLQKNIVIYYTKLIFTTWEKNKRKYLRFYKPIGHPSFIEINRENKKLYVVHEKKEINIYDFFTGKSHKHELDINKPKIEHIAFSVDYKYLYIVDYDSGLFKQNIQTNSKAKKIFKKLGSVTTISVTKDQHIILGFKNGYSSILTPSLKKIDVPKKMKHSIKITTICESKKLFAIADSKGHIQIWQGYNFENLLIKWHVLNVEKISFSPQGKYIAVFTKKSIYIYNMENIRERKQRDNQKDQEIRKFTMYRGYYKSGKTSFTEDWSKVCFPDGKGSIFIFEQKFLLYDKAFKKEIRRCDEAVKDKTPLLFDMKKIDEFLGKAKNSK